MGIIHMSKLFLHLIKKRLKAIILLIILSCSGIMLAVSLSACIPSEENASDKKAAAVVMPTNAALNIPEVVPSAKITIAAPTVTPSVKGADTKYNYDLYSLDFLDENNGWVIQWNYNDPVVHDITSIVHTRDGGANWETYPNNDFLLQKVSFADSESGWALAVEGHPELSEGNLVTYEILRTEDEGRNWEVQLTNETEYGYFQGFRNITDIAAINKNTVYASIGGILYHTQDGGTSWTEVATPVKDFSAEHIFILDEEHVWVSGLVKSAIISDQAAAGDTDYIQQFNYTAYLLQSTDGGQNWRIQFTKDCGTEWNEIIGISFADEENGWFQICNYSIMSGCLYHTINGGDDWDGFYGGGVRPYVQELEAVTPDILWIPMHGGAGPAEGGLGYTADGGKSFSFIGEEAGFVNSTGVEFVSPSLGWAIMNGFQDKYIMKTVDGGKTWKRT